MTSAAAVASLLDPIRLRVAGLLVDQTQTTASLQQLTGESNRRVLEAVADLRQAGLVDAVDDGYTLPAKKLRELAASLAETEVPMDPYIGHAMSDNERDILSRFFAGRTLVEIPTSRAKRRIVLERLALEFDIGVRYDESEINTLLHRFHEDHVSLRRYMVDEGFLDREAGDYWRSGGRTD